MTVIVNDETFANEVLKSDLPVLVDFYADWCGPCRMQIPVMEELSTEYEGRWKIVKCNVDESPRTAMEYMVTSIPTLMIVKGGKVEEKMMGFKAKDVLMEKMG